MILQSTAGLTGQLTRFLKKMKHRYNKVLMDKFNGATRTLAEPDNDQSANFRIVSHYGELDWSPYMNLEQAKQRFEEGLPQRPDGYFLLVEG